MVGIPGSVDFGWALPVLPCGFLLQEVVDCRRWRHLVVGEEILARCRLEVGADTGWHLLALLVYDLHSLRNLFLFNFLLDKSFIFIIKITI